MMSVLLGYAIIVVVGAVGSLVEVVLSANDSAVSLMKPMLVLAGAAAALVSGLLYYQVSGALLAGQQASAAALFLALVNAALVGFGAARLLANEVTKRALQRPALSSGTTLQSGTPVVMPPSSTVTTTTVPADAIVIIQQPLH